MGFYDPAETMAYCSGQCQASRYPPSSCRCPCQGRNHGILRGQRPINVSPREEYGFPSERVILSLPEERLRLTAQGLAHDLDRLPDLTVPNRVLETPTIFRAETQHKPRGRSIGRIGRSLKHSLVGYSETELNENILKGLHAQFKPENVELAIDQAFSVFYSKAPDLPRPELYELYETGLIDKALELMGKRWVIGRPKK